MTKKLIKMALAYDFDGTLAMGNIQENSFIPKLGMSKKEFWDEATKISMENDMDQILAYMYLLIKKADEKNVPINKDAFTKHGSTVKYFKGVEDYFNNINKYAKSKGVKLDHYIISSGNKEMIEGTSIAKYFKHIYACSFLYDVNGMPKWPAIALNYTSKTQFLFRINKGIENAWDNKQINKFVSKQDRTMPFENMIYIGDGETDIPAMKIVKVEGGHSIGVYVPNTKKPEGLLKEDRVNFLAPADYSKDSKLYKIIENIIDKVATDSVLKELK